MSAVPPGRSAARAARPTTRRDLRCIRLGIAMQDASAESKEAGHELSKAARRKARKERVLGGLEAQGVVLDPKASTWMEHRQAEHRHEIVDLCDDEPDDMSGIPLPQEAGPSTASPEVPPAAPSSRKRPLEAASDVSSSIAYGHT